MNGVWRNGKFVLESTIERREIRDREYIAKLEAGLKAVLELVDDSSGVQGLHRNGDLAEWDSIRAGGRFGEWLTPFDDAIDAMEKRKKAGGE